MDEVGRGTSVRDGLAIAFAVVHHLYFKNNCRALFATHFHELIDMLGCTSDYRGAGAFGKVGFFCTDVQETEVRSTNCSVFESLLKKRGFSSLVPSHIHTTCDQV
jgi:DNA mismatch repair ATPase MutS